MKDSPPGGTLVLTVKGVPKRSKATIVVKRAKHSHKTVKTHGDRTIRRLKPGTYRIKAQKLTTSKGTWLGRAKPAKVTVTSRKGARVRVVYTKRNSEVTPPVDEPDAPPTPFPDALAPASVTLVSKTPAGVPGNKSSTDPTWSPDGQYVAFSSCASDLHGTADGSCYIYLATVPGGAVTRVPSTRMDDIENWGGEPAWSPDGTRIAFTTMRALVAGDTDTNKDVYLVSPAGTNLQRVSQTQAGAGMQGSPAAAHDPQWSADSTRVLFRASATNLAAGAGDIYIKTLAGGAVARTGASERSEGARWSVDGRIAFTAGTETFNPATYDFDRTYDVYTASGTGGSVTAATGDHGVWGAPSWSPTGAFIAFSTTSALLAADTNSALDVYTTGGVRVSTGSGGEQSVWDAKDPVWSPDGQKVAYVTSATGPSTIVVKNLVTGSVTQLVDPTNGSECATWDYDEESGETYCAQIDYFGASDPEWSADSTRVAFTANYPGLVAGDTNKADDVFIATL